jgi:hypothetical protein
MHPHGLGAETGVARFAIVGTFWHHFSHLSIIPDVLFVHAF